jgi:hypothetical protein
MNLFLKSIFSHNIVSKFISTVFGSLHARLSLFNVRVIHSSGLHYP